VPRKPYNIRSIRQLEVMALPIRTEIVESVASLGPCSVADLSRVTARKRPALHFHVGKLVEVGLLVEAGDRGEGRNRETLYRTPGFPVYIIYDRNNPKNIEMTTRYSKNLLTQAQRFLARAFRSTTIRTSGRRRDTYVTQMTSWLTAAELVEVNEHIKALHALMRPETAQKGKRLFRLTLALSPLHPEAPAKTKRGKASAG
jgi:hypothetical protein